MNKKLLNVRILVTTALLGGLVLFGFNNCSDTTFSSSPKPGDDSGSSTSETPTTTPDDVLVANLPPEEQDIFRPISDLDDHPELYDIYKCPGGANGVLICHFPNNFDSAHTLCVGLAAVKSHQQHEVTFDSTGAVAVLSDYLGPCKH